LGITPFTYWSIGSALTTLSEPAASRVGTASKAPRKVPTPAIETRPSPVVRSRPPQSANGLPSLPRSFTVLPSRCAW
jgi:hypothetical protein